MNRKPYSYNYPGNLGTQIFKPMSNTHNLHSTDLDRNQDERIDPDHTKHLLGMVIFFMVAGLLICYAIVFIILYADMIDSIKPEVQLIILLVACLTFSSIRGYLWIRKTF